MSIAYRCVLSQLIELQPKHIVMELLPEMMPALLQVGSLTMVGPRHCYRLVPLFVAGLRQPRECGTQGGRLLHGGHPWRGG